MERYNTIIEMLRAQNPDTKAFQHVQNGRMEKISYAELLERVESFPVESGTVGLFMSGDIESIVAFFALAGKCRLVILNPSAPEALLEERIEKTGVDTLIGNLPDKLKSKLENIAGRHKEDVEPDILFFTSGTTSKSKAVVLTESNLCNATFNGASMLHLMPEDRLLAVLPLFHVFGFVCSVMWPLYCGSMVCLGNGIDNLFSDFTLYRPTVTCLVPQMAKFLAVNKLFNEELKLILMGAGVCNDDTLNLIKSMGIRISFGYGLTETASGIALSTGENPRLMSVCPDYTVKIADDGEILVKSATTLMKGYFDDPKATADVFSDGFLHTGDTGIFEDGFLTLKGRKKETMVFSDGTKLFIPEYEDRLLQFMGQNTDFAVVQDSRGLIVLYYFGTDDISEAVDNFNTENSRAHRISEIIYTADHLPRTETGKVKRYALAECRKAESAKKEVAEKEVAEKVPSDKAAEKKTANGKTAKGKAAVEKTQEGAKA